MSRYVVGVSGGIDSVVLLHMLTRLGEHDIIVAHFDHGIRDDSVSDAQFVQQLASEYGLPFETKREVLGQGASEELARRRRYEFLRAVAAKHAAQIVTAHHTDDLIETIAINHTRGTGWRGLAVLDSDIVRPFLKLEMNKQKIRDYAAKYDLAWREDSTNSDKKYLRNRLRDKLQSLPGDDKRQLLALHAAQLEIKKQIDTEVKRLVGAGPLYSRYFFTHAHHRPAIEILRHVTRGLLTRPQLERALIIIKTARARTNYQAGSGVEFRFTPRHFVVELIK